MFTAIALAVVQHKVQRCDPRFTHDHIHVLFGLGISAKLVANFAILAHMGADAATEGSCRSEDHSQWVDMSIVYQRDSRCRT